VTPLPLPLEVDVFAGKREKALELRLTFEVALRPIVDGLTADQDVGAACGTPKLEDFGKFAE